MGSQPSHSQNNYLYPPHYEPKDSPCLYEHGEHFTSGWNAIFGSGEHFSGTWPTPWVDLYGKRALNFNISRRNYLYLTKLSSIESPMNCLQNAILTSGTASLFHEIIGKNLRFGKNQSFFFTSVFDKFRTHALLSTGIWFAGLILYVVRQLSWS